MRQIYIPEEAYLLHGLRFSGYLETLTRILANGGMVVNGLSKSSGKRIQFSADNALDKEYYKIFAEFYEQGGDLALSEPDELWDLILQVFEFYNRNDLLHHSDIISRWNMTWQLFVDYEYFTGDKAPELTLESNGGSYMWRVVCQRKKDFKWSSREFVKHLNISICPYCNLNPLSMDSIKKGKQSYFMNPDMDHYFDKGDYPFLALNIYNLIPACDICNRRIKESRRADYSLMAHPYKDDVHEQVIVKVDEKVIDNPYGNRVCDEWLRREGRVAVVNAQRGVKSFDFFGIIDLCKNPVRKQQLLRVITNAAVKKNYRDVCRRQFGGFMDDKQFEVQCYGCSLNPAEINQWPLSKITIDLVAQIEERKRLGRSVL